MGAINWAKSYQLKNEKNQEQMERAIHSLQEGKLGTMGDYDQEAFTKTFCEGILHLESNLLYTNDIHPKNLDMVKVSMNPGDYQKKHQEVESYVEVHIRRQLRLFTRMINAL